MPVLLDDTFDTLRIGDNVHYIETKRDKMGHMFGAPNPVGAE